MSLLGFDPNKYRTTTAAQTKPQEQGRFGDVVDSFQAGAASGLGGIFDFIGADGIAKSLYGIANDQYGQMSSRGQEAMGKQMFQTNAQGETELGEGMTDLDTWLLQMANVAGQFVPTAVPGAGAAGLATKALSLGSKGAKVAQAVGMGATGGSAATGQAMDQARQEVLKMPDQVLADSDLFKQTFLNIDAQSPELDDVSKWNQAKSQLAEQVASEVRSDPKALLANFAASAIGDPVIGRALTGVRLAKSGALRSALAGGITEGATEATQAGVSQYAVDNVLSQIDQRDPMAGVKLAALNEGIIGAGFGAGAGGIGGIDNRNVANTDNQREPAKNPAADPIRESNPTVAGAMDADAQQAADRKADIESMAQAAQPSQQPNYDQPTAARRAGMGDTMQAGRFGDEAIARDNAMKGRSFPTVPEQFNKSPLTQAMDSVQGLTDQRREGEWLPPEGEGRSPVTGLLAAPFIDGENLSRQRTRDTMAAQQTNLIGQSDTIFANDGRARQAAQQFADTTARQTAAQPKQITDKGIIFAPDTFSPQSQGINVKSNNTPFASAKEALISKGARAAKREGAEIEAVKLNKGFGWRVVPKVEPDNIESTENGLSDNKSNINQLKKQRDRRYAENEVKQAENLVFETQKKIEQQVSAGGRIDILSKNLQRQISGANKIRAKYGLGPMDLDQDLADNKSNRATGKTSKVFTPSNKEIETEYQLIEADELIASNDFTGKVDPRYPASRQPRDRSRASSQLQIAAIANDPNPARLADSAESDRGAPIVSGNIVESGNGRSIGLKEAYARGSAEKYRKYLVDNAEQFGFTPEQISAMKSPVLVRQRITDLTEDEIRAFTVDSNKSASLELSPMESAKADSETITDDMLDILSVPDNGNVLSSDNRQFVQAFTKRMNQQELARYLTADGGFNKDFGTRLERAIFAKAYDNDALLEQVAEAATTEQKNLINSLTNVAGKMSQLRNVAPKVWQQISGIISDATGLVMRSRRQGKPISELVSQGDMMTGYVTKEVDTLASAIDANIRSGKKITTLLDSVISSLINANSNQGSMFDADPLTVEQAISYVEQQQATQPELKPGGDLFGANPRKLETSSERQTDSIQSAGERSPGESRQELTPPNAANSNIDATTFTDKQYHDTQIDQAEIKHIADFGEKIGGARKDVWGGFSEAIKDQQNTKELPLSKSWPEPDYQELADNGTDREALALIAAMRAQIPPKPRMTYKVERWANNVNELKTMALSLIDGSLSVEQVKKAMSTKSSDLSGIANAAPVLAKADLGLLKGVANYRIQSGRFTVFGGKEYPQGKNLYFISRDRRTMYDGASETLSEVQALLSKIINADQESGAAGPKAKQSKIDVYTDRYTKQAFLGWKGAKGVLRIKTFESVPAARDYLKQNRDEVESTLARMKETPNERRVENAARIGPERFSGNVTPAIFADTFGFRGVEFGNYVEQVKRQKDLNQAYDALMDLAEVIDIPPKAISLNGELGLAFGARGKGGSLGGGLTAAAHYEPGNIVINLTKKAGAGSLAHEWYHALDNYFSRKRGDASSFISERPYPLMNKGVREEVLEAFKGIKKAIHQSELVSRAKALDSRRSTAYWSTDIELGARAFESFIIAELERKGMTNDYLANIVSQEYWDAAEALGLEDGSTYPYPNQIEASSINAAYQSLFETIDVREGDSGNIELFSKASKGANRGARLFTQAEAQRAVDDVMKRLSGAAGIRVNLFTSQDEFLSRFNVPAMAMEGQTIYGAYDDRRNSAYLILDNFKSIDELRSTLVHEVLAHGGLHTVIGAQKYQQFIDKLNSSRSRKEFKELWAKIDKDYNGASDAVKAEEVFANFVQNQPERGTAKAWWFELTKWLRRQLEGLGIIKSNITRNEMEDMMQAIVRGFDKRKQRMDRAQRVLDRSGKMTDNLRFSQSSQDDGMGNITDKPELKAGESVKIPKTKKPIDWVMTNFDKLSQSDVESVMYQLDANGDWDGMDPYYAKKAFKTLTADLSALEKQVTKYGFVVYDIDSFINELNAKSQNHYDTDFYNIGAAYRDDIIDSLARHGLSQYEIDNGIANIRFSKTAEPDTRTAKQKLGLEEEAEQTLKEKITENYRNTADTLKQSSFWSRLNEGIFDGLHGIKKAEEAAGITDPNKMGYVSARLASGLSDVLHGVFHYGAPMWKDGIIQRKADTKGLLEVFGMLPDGELNNWLAWMGANRAKQLKAQGRENNLSQADIDELLALADGKEKLFEEVRAEYNKINSAVLDVAQGAGLISAEQRAGFDEQYYVPFFREQDVDPEMQDIASMVVAPFTKKGIAGQSAKIKELKGGKQSTKDLLENIILRQSTMLDAALKNKAMLEVTDNLSGTEFMTEVDSPEFAKLSQRELNSIQRVKVMRDGQAVAYAVTDPALLRGLIAVNDVGSQALFNRMGRSAKRFLTTGVTLSPDFIFKNFVRDAAHAWMINKDDFKLGTDSVKGLKKAFKEDEAYRDLIFSGAAFQGGYIHGADPEAAAQQIRRALAQKGLAKGQIDSYMDSLVTSGSKLFEKYRNLSDKVENANRLSTYEAGLASGKSRRQAAFEAKDLMDYSLKGNFALISTMIDFLPFFNARLQGMYKLARASAAGENDKVLKVLSANLAMKGLKVAAFSLALAAMNDDDDRYKELPDWDKDANWHFWIGDDHFRIPKPFELGVVFGTLPERLFGFGTGSQTGSDLGRAVGNAVFNTMALNPIPQIALPVVEVMTNKSFFKGTAIEGMGDEQRMPGDRYNAYTSDTAREVGQLLNVSPKKIEHLVNGYAGTLGGYVLAMSDMMARQMLGKEKPETPISRYPIIKAFYGGDDPNGSTYYQNEFYKALDAANQAYGSYKRAAEEQDSSRMIAVLEDNRDKLGVRIALNRVQRQVSALSKQAEMVNNSSMSPSEKREKLDAITSQKNAIYQSAYVGFNLREW